MNTSANSTALTQSQCLSTCTFCMHSLLVSLDLRVPKEKVCFALDVKKKLLQCSIQPVTVSDVAVM